MTWTFRFICFLLFLFVRKVEDKVYFLKVSLFTGVGGCFEMGRRYAEEIVLQVKIFYMRERGRE